MRLLKRKIGEQSVGKPKVYEGDVPGTPQQFTDLLDLRPPAWEYLYFAGLLKENLRKSEALYRDFLLEYGPPNGATKRGQDAADYLQEQLAQLSQVAASLETVLSHDAQIAAFGAPGEPGDLDRIAHLSQRVGDLYVRLLLIASDLRGTAFMHDGFRDAAEMLATAVKNPVEVTRATVETLCERLQDAPARLSRGETTSAEIAMVWELPDGVLDGYAVAVQRGLEDV